MTDQQRQEPLTQSSAGNVERVERSMCASAAGLRLQDWQQEQEKEWECQLRNLQQSICELLIKNQQLRESLNSATNRRSLEVDNEYHQKFARNQS